MVPGVPKAPDGLDSDGQPIGAPLEEDPTRRPPYAADRRLELVTWDEAKAWWPHGQIPRSLEPPTGARTEWVYAVSNRGGRRGDPDADYAVLSIIYSSGGSSPDTTNGATIRQRGGVMVRVAFYPTGVDVAHTNEWYAKPVVVRGQPAKMVEMSTQDGAELRGNQDLRSIYWQLPIRGGNLQWEVMVDPTAHSYESTVDFIEKLAMVS